MGCLNHSCHSIDPMVSETEMTPPAVTACWRALACSEAPASLCASAASYRFSKDVFIVPVVETDLELREIQGKLFLAYMMVRPDDAPFEQAPERFDVVGMDFTAHVFAFAMRHK